MSDKEIARSAPVDLRWPEMTVAEAHEAAYAVAPANADVLTDEDIRKIAIATSAEVQKMPDEAVTSDTWERCFARAILQANGDK